MWTFDVDDMYIDLGVEAEEHEPVKKLLEWDLHPSSYEAGNYEERRERRFTWQLNAKIRETSIGEPRDAWITIKKQINVQGPGNENLMTRVNYERNKSIEFNQTKAVSGVWDKVHDLIRSKKNLDVRYNDKHGLSLQTWRYKNWKRDQAFYIKRLDEEQHTLMWAKKKGRPSDKPSVAEVKAELLRIYESYKKLINYVVKKDGGEQRAQDDCYNYYYDIACAINEAMTTWCYSQQLDDSKLRGVVEEKLNSRYTETSWSIHNEGLLRTWPPRRGVRNDVYFPAREGWFKKRRKVSQVDYLLDESRKPEVYLFPKLLKKPYLVCICEIKTPDRMGRRMVPLNKSSRVNAPDETNVLTKKQQNKQDTKNATKHLKHFLTDKLNLRF